jgi:excisionase family DNA binding protein
MRKRTSQNFEQDSAIAGIPETLTKQAVCETLGCSLQTVDRMISSGELRAYRIGKRMVRVDAASVRAFFAHPSNSRVLD